MKGKKTRRRGVKKYYALKPRKGADLLVFMAIPATGNCFRRHSLGGFKPSEYIDEHELPKAPYDLVTFVRDPVQRFVAVWPGYKGQWRQPSKLMDWLELQEERGVSDGIDTHFRRQSYFETDKAKYIGHFETLKEDWKALQGIYGLGEFRLPPTVNGTPIWSDTLKGEDLKRVLDYYWPDFVKYGYDNGIYVRR